MPSASKSKPDVAPKRKRHGLSIQSSLLIMFMIVSLLSSVVVGLIGYVNGSDSLRDAAFDRLIGVRDSRAREITSLFEQIKNSVLIQSRSSMTVAAATDFATAFDELSDSKLTDDETKQIRDYYEGPFSEKLNTAIGADADVAGFLPQDAAESYLQLHYTIPFDDFSKSIETVDAGDGSPWSAANAKYHDQFRRIVELLKYEDLLLIDSKGNVVYSVYKGVDLGTNLLDGAYSFSNLADAYRKSMNSNLLGSVQFTDFGDYPPSIGIPAAWAVAPIGIEGQPVGAIAVELPVDAINQVMTGDFEWQAKGLGKTGETYLVGSDNLMRSSSREVIEKPDDYKKAAVATGLDSELAARIANTGVTLLAQPVDTIAVSKALAGETGTIVGANYLGESSLAAYRPMKLEGLNWVIVAEIGSAEAFAPVQTFTRNLALSATVLIVIVSLLSLILAQIIVRPLRRLKLAASKIAAGEQDVQVDAGSSDELADVGNAFNDMSQSLQVKAKLLDEQIAENERLLLTLMPQSVAKRFRNGDQNIVEDHQEVSVIYAEIMGFDDYSRSLKSNAALEELNEVLKSFDEAAEAHGVEKVRTTRNGYLACCGLNVPRVDNARRIVDFALDIQQILARYGKKLGTNLSIRAGIDTGTVTSGLIGRSQLVYDLWGDAVTLALKLRGDSSEPGVLITQRVKDHLPAGTRLNSVGTVETAIGAQSVWSLDLNSANV